MIYLIDSDYKENLPKKNESNETTYYIELQRTFNQYHAIGENTSYKRKDKPVKINQ